MPRRHLRGLTDRRADVREVVSHIFRGPLIDQRVVVLRPNLLAEKHRKPVRRCEELVTIAHDPAAVPELLDLVGQRLWNLHVAAVLPQRRIVTRCRLVVKNEEVADALVLIRGHPVVLIDEHRRDRLDLETGSADA